MILIWPKAPGSSRTRCFSVSSALIVQIHSIHEHFTRDTHAEREKNEQTTHFHSSAVCKLANWRFTRRVVSVLHWTSRVQLDCKWVSPYEQRHKNIWNWRIHINIRIKSHTLWRKCERVSICAFFRDWNEPSISPSADSTQMDSEQTPRGNANIFSVFI